MSSGALFDRDGPHMAQIKLPVDPTYLICVLSTRPLFQEKWPEFSVCNSLPAADGVGKFSVFKTVPAAHGAGQFSVCKCLPEADAVGKFSVFESLPVADEVGKFVVFKVYLSRVRKIHNSESTQANKKPT